MKSTNDVTPKRNSKKFVSVLRNYTGQAILAAGTIAFIAQNLDQFSTAMKYGAAVLFVLLVLNFANYKSK